MKEKAYALFKEKLARFKEIALDETSTITEIDAAKNATLMYLPKKGGSLSLLKQEDELVRIDLSITDGKELYFAITCKNCGIYLRGEKDILELYRQIYNIKKL